MTILVLEPFYSGSHKQWVDGLKQHSGVAVILLTLPGRHWKWRMHQSAVHFADMLIDFDGDVDFILCNDLIDVATFRGLLKSNNSSVSSVPVATYFHENQITYPWSANDPDVLLKRDNHYGWINFTTALASDYLFFNSNYHKQSFLEALPGFLGQFPDNLSKKYTNPMVEKSHVLPISLDLQPFFNLKRKENSVPIILWNHRWEYDKNPFLFFNTLFRLKADGVPFKLLVLGENYKNSPSIFDEAKEKLKNEILYFGFVDSRQKYFECLAMSDIIPVTSNQDFFGISAVEAIAAGAYPLLPDRLAFSEHLEEEQFYYQNDKDFFHKLKKLLLSHKTNSSNARGEIAKYDWSNMRSAYQYLFEKVSLSSRD